MSHATPTTDDLPPPHDPLKDIDGVKVVASLAGTAVVLFVGLFLLYALFGTSVGDARNELINQAYNKERVEALGGTDPEGAPVMGSEKEILAGKLMSGAQAKPIDQVLQELAEPK